MKPIGEALRDLLADRGWTVTDLWAAADLSPAVTYRYLTGERGRRMNSQALRTVEKLATALDIKPEYFREYRIHQLERAMETHPELVDVVYDVVMSELRKTD